MAEVDTSLLDFLEDDLDLLLLGLVWRDLVRPRERERERDLEGRLARCCDGDRDLDCDRDDRVLDVDRLRDDERFE